MALTLGPGFPARLGNLAADVLAAGAMELHRLSIRARAGVPRAELREIARKAVSVICG